MGNMLYKIEGTDNSYKGKFDFCWNKRILLNIIMVDQRESIFTTNILDIVTKQVHCA